MFRSLFLTLLLLASPLTASPVPRKPADAVTSLAQRTDRLFADLTNRRYRFDFNRQIATEVKKLDPRTLAAFFHHQFIEKPIRLIGISPGKAEQNSPKGKQLCNRHS
jgi:secreted Zn-dependent insulinase-like peptidase